MTHTLFIDPGLLKAELVLERMTPAPDGMGGYAEAWSELAVVWGRIEPVSTAQRDFGVRPRPEVTHRIFLRFRDDVENGMRLRRGDRLFAVRAVHDPDESGRYLVCLAVEEGR